MRAMLERLTEAYIELKVIIRVALINGNGDIEADRAEPSKVT
jgi:hypothetical protein